MNYNTTVKTNKFFKSHHPKHSSHWQIISQGNFSAKINQKPTKFHTHRSNSDTNHRDLAMVIALAPKSTTHNTISSQSQPATTATKPRFKIGNSTTFSKLIYGDKVKKMIKKLTKMLTKKLKSSKTNLNHKLDLNNSRIGEIEPMHITNVFTPYTLTPISDKSTGVEYETGTGYLSPRYHPLNQVSPLPIYQLLLPPLSPTKIECTKAWESPFSDTEWGEFTCAGAY